MKGASDAEAYKPTADYEEFNKDFDIDITGDKELWLIQWPLNSTPDIDGQTVSMNPRQKDGLLGSVEGPTGKQYDFASYDLSKASSSVFLSSSSGCQMVEISRRVNVEHLPDPKELLESTQSVYKKMAERSAAASSLTGSRSASRFLSKSSGLKSGRTSTIVTGGSMDTSKPTRSIYQSLEDSRRDTDSGAPSGISEQSQERKSKKKKMKAEV